jgi:hypothetical protein
MWSSQTFLQPITPGNSLFGEPHFAEPDFLKEQKWEYRHVAPLKFDKQN